MPTNAKGQDLLMLKDVKDVAQHYSQPCHHPLVGVFRLNFHGKETGPAYMACTPSSSSTIP